MDRMTRLRGTSTRLSRILEIGPSHAPVAPKADGWNSFVVDHATREELWQKYQHDPTVNLNAIEAVDAVWRGGALDAAIPNDLHGTFDTLIASHVIEHLPDLAGFLVAAQRLLTPSGTIVLAIPDRRYCFDYFKPATLTGDVLEAYVAQRSRHATRTLWNQMAYSVAWDGATAWGQHRVHEAAFTSDFEHAKARFASFRNGTADDYIDCHTWHFTPAGFALVILELGQLDVIDWYLDSLHGPEGCEFIAILRRGIGAEKGSAVVQQDRMRLLRQQLTEMLEQLDFVLGTARAEMEHAAAAQRDEITALRDTLYVRTAELAAAKHELAVHREEVSTLRCILYERHGQEVELAEAEHTVAAQREELSALRGALEERTVALTDTEQSAAAQRHEATTLRGSLEQRQRELTRVQRLLDLRNTDLRFAQSRMASLTALAEQWQKERDIILTSRSWRITEPLRAVSGAVRMVAQRVRSRRMAVHGSG
ncbi:MAG TPA: methyltransferase domain-containing protein [Acetobacteraceae bacterium]|nr:methyltransferase domain-containing protein [Acetobacteraceae bacterium]